MADEIKFIENGLGKLILSYTKRIIFSEHDQTNLIFR